MRVRCGFMLVACFVAWFVAGAAIASAQVSAANLPAAPAQQLVLTGQVVPGGGAGASAAGSTLTREQAEQIALKNNPRISVATLLSKAQREVVRETRSNELPTVTGQASVVGAEQASRWAADDPAASRLLNHAGAGLELQQLIFDFGRTHELVASSSLQAKAAAERAEATREDVVLAVDLAFYEALEAQATLKVAQSTVDARQAVSTQVGALTQSNLRSTLDLSFANVNLSQAQLLLLDAEDRANAAMAQLNEVLGLSSANTYTLVDDAGAPPALPGSADEMIALALQQRPDLQAQKLSHDADVHFTRAQRLQMLPTLSGIGVAGVIPFGSPTYFTSTWYGAAGASVNVPVFNGFRFNAETAEARFRAQASDQASRELIDVISRDVRTAWLNANTAEQRMNVTKQLVNQANMALDLAQTRYNLGLSSIVELSQAQLAQTQAQIDDAIARFRYEADLATIRFQTGTQP